VRVNPGDYVFGDEDGIMIIPRAITIEVLEKAEAVCARENRIRDAIDGSTSLADLYTKFGQF
jgi:regulator of RNase E activity RraA